MELLQVLASELCKLIVSSSKSAVLGDVFSERISYKKSGAGALKALLQVWHRLGNGGYFRIRKSGAAALRRQFQV